MLTVQAEASPSSHIKPRDRYTPAQQMAEEAPPAMVAVSVPVSVPVPAAHAAPEAHGEEEFWLQLPAAVPSSSPAVVVLPRKTVNSLHVAAAEKLAAAAG
jgi:hypothetical protein